MTPQELFDTVVSNLRKQGAKSLLDEEQNKSLSCPSGTCAYLSRNGNRCAIGGLLTDDEYDPNMEGRPLLEVIERAPTFINRIGTDNIRILQDLQFIHDGTEVEWWEKKFQKLAADYELIYTPPAAS